MRIPMAALVRAAASLSVLGSSAVWPALAADAPEGFHARYMAVRPLERHAVVEEPAWRRVVVEEPGSRRIVVEEQPMRWERRVYVRQERRAYDAYQEPGPNGRWREED